MEQGIVEQFNIKNHPVEVIDERKICGDDGPPKSSVPCRI
jgi:hypothetical protein